MSLQGGLFNSDEKSNCTHLSHWSCWIDSRSIWISLVLQHSLFNNLNLLFNCTFAAVNMTVGLHKTPTTLMYYY